MVENRQFMVLSALGPDKPGLVAEVTRFLGEHGANVEDSRMAVLGGEFAIILLFSAAKERGEALARAKAALEKSTGLSVTLKPTVSPEIHRKSAVVPCHVAASALDQEGIVHAISKALHGAGVNIVSLETSAYHAPVTGSPLFRLEANVDVPRGVTVGQVRQALEDVANQHGFDVEVRAGA